MWQIYHTTLISHISCAVILLRFIFLIFYGNPTTSLPSLSLSFSLLLCSALSTRLSHKTCISPAAEAEQPEMSTDRIKLKLHFGPHTQCLQAVAIQLDSDSSSCCPHHVLLVVCLSAVGCPRPCSVIWCCTNNVPHAAYLLWTCGIK